MHCLRCTASMRRLRSGTNQRSSYRLARSKLRTPALTQTRASTACKRPHSSEESTSWPGKGNTMGSQIESNCQQSRTSRMSSLASRYNIQHCKRRTSRLN